MILFTKFGYALRHQISFHVKAKRGALTLWSHYDGSGIGTDPLMNDQSSLTELVAYQFAVRGALFGANYITELPLGSESDVFSLLVAVIMLKNGKEFSFSNFQDRTISFTPRKVGKENRVITVVKIRYSSRAGILTPEEVNELETLTREILSNLGYSKQEIAEKLERLIVESSN